ncbi:endonuclease I [Enterobacter roggenkampii]|uniref:endonuclease I n=1 Tax=Enterobacter roggenkampii TaxID=1812935 RepID=UPI0035D50ED9
MKENKYRSSFEKKVASKLKPEEFNYESKKYEYTVVKNYTPDFELENGILVETKGQWTSADRTKHKLVREANPELDIRIVFQADNKLNKKSKTRYSDYCNRMGWKYVVGNEIPKEWLNENSNRDDQI